jgi:CHAD domain-containing protein
MAYRIKKGDDGVQDAVRRIADEQLGRALEEFDDPELSLAGRIHQVRKRCKKLRGLIRMVRPAFDGYGDENRAIRDAARMLSGVRDAGTLIATYDAVADHFADEIERRSFGPIRARLTRDARKAREDPGLEARLAEVGRALAAVRERAAGWKLDETGFGAVGGGAGKTYKRARRRMEAAWAEPSDAAMHAWRKRVKYHWYHARLLRPINPPMMEPEAEAADRLSDLLGDHHDLAVLDARLHESPGDFGPATDVDAFRALVGGRRDALSEQTLELGRTILAERKKALVKRWGGYWKVWAKGDVDPGRLLVKP